MLVKPPPLNNRADAVRFVRELKDNGYEIYWHKESSRLVTRPKKAGEKTMECVTRLLELRSSRDWDDFKSKEGLD